MKLLIYLAVWKRPEITEICFMGITRLRESGLFPIDALAVISEESMIPLCEKYQIRHCFYKNLPLGEKLNYGLQIALTLEWDYVICIGSDDLIKTELLELYRPHFGYKPMLSVRNFVYLNSTTLKCRLIESNVNGLGRAIHRRVIEQYPKLWPAKGNQGMDKSSLFMLAQNGILDTRLSGIGPMAIDIKSQTNIWSYEAVLSLGTKFGFNETVQGLSLQEIEAIKELQYVAA